MAILGHCLVLFILVSISSSIAGIHGERAQSLALPGSSIASLTPAIVAVLYVSGEVLSRRGSRKAHWVQLLVTLAILYPMIIYWMFSHTIATSGTISGMEIQRFKKEFSVPVVFEYESGSFRATVASKVYDPRMVDWLRGVAAIPPKLGR